MTPAGNIYKITPDRVPDLGDFRLTEAEELSLRAVEQADRLEMLTRLRAKAAALEGPVAKRPPSVLPKSLRRS
jgi:hypothetical protein